MITILFLWKQFWCQFSNAKWLLAARVMLIWNSQPVKFFLSLSSSSRQNQLEKSGWQTWFFLFKYFLAQSIIICSANLTSRSYNYKKYHESHRHDILLIGQGVVHEWRHGLRGYRIISLIFRKFESERGRIMNDVLYELPLNYHNYISSYSCSKEPLD